jgi:hypothetical protein
VILLNAGEQKSILKFLKDVRQKLQNIRPLILPILPAASIAMYAFSI